MKSLFLTLLVPLVTKTEFILHYQYDIKQTRNKNKEKNNNQGIFGWSNSKFFNLTSQIVWQSVRRINHEILRVNG